MSQKKILIIAGETSGDKHGAQLVRNILAQLPRTSIYGIGGDAMAEAGVDLIRHSSRLSVVGIVEVVGRLPEILQAFRMVKNLLKHDPPDLVILIDFPDFNLRVARQAARRNIPVVYYISPQLWAWRRGRIHRIAKTVRHMIVIFPFEKALYERYGIPVSYVGHPLLDHAGKQDVHKSPARARKEAGLSPLFPVVGLFPGSRSGEVRAHLPPLLEAAEELSKRFPRTQFLLGEAPGLEEGIYDDILGRHLVPVKRVRSGILPVVGMCDLALVASGTATMEVALLEVPMVIVYRVSRVTYLLGKLLIRVPAIGMVNLILQKWVVPELIQDGMNRDSILECCNGLMTNAVYHFSVKKELSRIRRMLGTSGASERAAGIVVGLLRAEEDRGP